MNNMISLSKLFDKRIFRIPDYQRGYAWQTPQLIDFWDDLINLAEDRYHYTGMLSLKKLKRNDYINWDEEKWLINQDDYEAFHIVDGQQRLTTFIILLNSIVKKAEAEKIEYINNSSVADIKSRYIVEYKKPEKILKAYKFGYEKDNPSFKFLRYKILGEDAAGTIQETFYTLNLEIAKEFFDKNVDELYNKGKLKALETLYNKLVNKLQFNIHDIDDDFDVFVAFETMNNRGKKLSNLEILKNRLIYLTTIFPNASLSPDEKAQMRRDINEAWSEVYYQLGRNKKKPLNDDDYLKNHWIIYFTYSRKKGDDYINFLLNRFFTTKAIFGIKNGFEYDEPVIDEDSSYENEDDLIIEPQDDAFDGVLYPSEITNYIKSLKSVARYWYYSFNPEKSNLFTEDEKKWIDKLNRIGINYFRPLVVVSYLNNTITSEQRVLLFKTIEKFIFLCFRMARYQASYYSSQIYSYTHRLLKNEMSINEIIDDIETKFTNNIIEFTTTFITRTKGLFKNGDGFYSWWDLPYFLFEYELSLSEKTNVGKLTDWSNFVKNEKDKISIEHIFPQTPTRWYWKNQFRDYKTAEKKCLAGSLGNLLALAQSVNSALQNDEFDKKKNGTDKRTRGYYNGSYSEMEVAKYVDWNPDTILKRGLHLLDFMENRWGFKFSDDVETEHKMRLELLGIEFVEDERTITEELPKEIQADRNYVVNEEGVIKVTEHLKNKSPEMVELYNALYNAVKALIPDMFEVATNPYIAFRNVLNKNFAEIWIQSRQLKIMVRYIENGYEIGEKINDSYNWTNNYKIILKRFEDIDKVSQAIKTNYDNL